MNELKRGGGWKRLGDVTAAILKASATDKSGPMKRGAEPHRPCAASNGVGGTRSSLVIDENANAVHPRSAIARGPRHPTVQGVARVPPVVR